MAVVREAAFRQGLFALFCVVVLTACSTSPDSEVSTSVLGRTVGSPVEGLTRTVAEPTSEPSSPDLVESGASTSTVASSVAEQLGDGPDAEAVETIDAPVAPTASADVAQALPLPAVPGPVTAAETPAASPNVPDASTPGGDDVPPGADVVEPETTTSNPPLSTTEDAPPGAEELPAAVPPSVEAASDADDAPPGALDGLEEAANQAPPDEPDAPPGALDLP